MTGTVIDPEVVTPELIEREAILQRLGEQNAESLHPGGDYVLQRFDDAILQSADPGAMTATFVIVTRQKQPNRHGNQVQIIPGPNGKGMLTQLYARNPVVLYNHGLGIDSNAMSLPVGLSENASRELSLKLSDTKAIATCYFSKLPHAEPIFASVNEGILRMASIGFSGLKAMSLELQKEKLAAGVESMNYWRGLDFTESELFEWSITPVGADRGALRQALDRGKIHDVKIPRFLRQSWEPLAEEKKAQGVGFVPPAAPAPVAQTVVETPAVPPPVATPAPPEEKPQTPAGLTAEQIREHVTQALANSQKVEKAAADIRQTMEEVAGNLAQTIKDAFAPIREQQQQIDDRLKAITGKLD